VIVGQKRLHATRMAHNDENAAEVGGANRGKVPQPGWCCGASDAYDPQSGPDWGAGSGTRAHQDGKVQCSAAGDEAELSAFEAAMEDGLGGEMPIANK